MVYIFLADGFEEMEAIAPIDILRRANIEVKTVGVNSKTITSSRNVKVTTDILDSEAVFEGLSMIVLPGGPGTNNLKESPIVKRFIQYAFDKSLYIGAICAAPTILGEMGLLKGVEAICFPGYEGKLKGAVISSLNVVADKKIITANAAGSSLEFALMLVSVLKGKEIAQNIKKQLVM